MEPKSNPSSLLRSLAAFVLKIVKFSSKAFGEKHEARII
jgi:hypothetical protein